MTNLQKLLLIKREALDEASYFQSFLQEAYRLNLLTDSELEDIQLQSLQLLARQTESYTGGESSSVKIETAQNIFQSIFYCIGGYLKHCPDTDKCLTEIKHKPIAELFQQGKKLLEIQVVDAKKLLDIIQNDPLVTENCAYNDTLQNGILAFFSDYNIHFAAHDTPASIDYPLSNDKMDLVGVEYLYGYLQKLHLENQFCKGFTAQNIRYLLRGYNDHYQDLLINIFGLVLTNAIGCVLVNKDPLHLNIESADRQYLQQKLVNLPMDHLGKMLENASNEICHKLNISDRLLQEHITATSLTLPVRLKNALENNRLESIFLSLKEDPKEPVVQFEDGLKMEDEHFRRVADEIRQCRYVSDKITIIKREIHSFTDLVDILEGYCIFDDEFAEVFQSLEDMDLALLLKRIPQEIIDVNFELMEIEKDWHSRLTLFLQEINATRRDLIKELAETIDLV